MKYEAKEKRRRAVKVAKAINSIEGVPIPDETNEFFQQWIDSEISDDQLTEPELFTPVPDNRLNTEKTQIKMKNGLSPKR